MRTKWTLVNPQTWPLTAPVVVVVAAAPVAPVIAVQIAAQIVKHQQNMATAEKGNTFSISYRLERCNVLCLACKHKQYVHAWHSDYSLKKIE